MKVAVLSDIHGNYVALQKCLEHAGEQKVDAYFFLGDYLGEFPYPQRTMQILYDLRKEKHCVFIRGNKEDYWLNRRNNVNCDWKEGNHSIGAMKYVYENLNAKDFSFFESLSICESVHLDGTSPILLCHGSPTDNRVKMLADNEQVREIVAPVVEKYILCGHTHTQQIVLDDRKKIWNGGAVGVPRYGKGVTQYMLLTSDGQEWKHSFVSLGYDVDRVAKEIHESGLWDITPHWCRITEHLLYHGTPSHGDVLNDAMRINSYKNPWYGIPDEDWEEALKENGI